MIIFPFFLRKIKYEKIVTQFLQKVKPYCKNKIYLKENDGSSVFSCKKTIPLGAFFYSEGDFFGQSGTPVPTVKVETAIYAVRKSI